MRKHYEQLQSDLRIFHPQYSTAEPRLATVLPGSSASQVWKTENSTARAIKECRAMDHGNV